MLVRGRPWFQLSASFIFVFLNSYRQLLVYYLKLDNNSFINLLVTVEHNKYKS